MGMRRAGSHNPSYLGPGPLLLSDPGDCGTLSKGRSTASGLGAEFPAAEVRAVRVREADGERGRKWRTKRLTGMTQDSLQRTFMLV